MIRMKSNVFDLMKTTVPSGKKGRVAFRQDLADVMKKVLPDQVDDLAAQTVKAKAKAKGKGERRAKAAAKGSAKWRRTSTLNKFPKDENQEEEQALPSEDDDDDEEGEEEEEPDESGVEK